MLQGRKFTARLGLRRKIDGRADHARPPGLGRHKPAADAVAADEAFRIGREAHIPIEIFHLKASGKRNWGGAPRVIAATVGPGRSA